MVDGWPAKHTKIGAAPRLIRQPVPLKDCVDDGRPEEESRKTGVTLHLMTTYPLTEEAVDEIESDFIENYNAEYWFWKYKLLELALDEPETVLDLLDVNVEDDEAREAVITELEMFATSEIVYTFYHTAETLFALMMASTSRAPWLVLKEYGPGQLWRFARSIADTDPDENRDEEVLMDRIGARFYPTLPSDDDRLRESTREILHYLERMFWHFDRNELYNSYKHGLRLITDEEHITIIDGETDEKKQTLGGYAHVYLEDEVIDVSFDNDEDPPDGPVKQLTKVVRAHNVELFEGMIGVNHELINHLIGVIEMQYEDETGEVTVSVYQEDTLTSVFDTGSSDSFFEGQFPYDVGRYMIEVG